MDQKYLTMKDNTKIFTLIHNDGHEKTAVFVHGGPGAGSDYFLYQAQLLSKHMNVIIYDQRGVYRSDSIINPDDFNIDILLDDQEEIRNQLNINKWTLIGHSFGGMLSLLYANKYPNYVDKVIFECPTFHFLDSIDSTCLKIIDILKSSGKVDLAENVYNVMTTRANHVGYLQKVLEITPDNVITKVYHPFPIDVEAQKINFNYNFSNEQRVKTSVHIDCVLKDEIFSRSQLMLLKDLAVPSLLLLGEYDIICTAKQQNAYTHYANNGGIVRLPNCGHTCHNESPVLFVDTISKFILL
jgi:proline iminopeptidase